MIRLFAPLGLLALAPAVTAQVVYVRAAATGANNGATWADAYRDLQTALGATSAGEIWVAAGTYRPAAPSGSQLATFALRRGVALYGGFAGTETARDQRDPAQHEAILSGDLDGDDGANWSGMQENSDHVVTASGVDATAVLDGFTIAAGYVVHDGGAGILVQDGAPTLRRCTVRGCVSNWGWGAGIAARGRSTLDLADSVVTGNYAHLSRGGGLAAGSGVVAILERCRFAGNRATGSTSDGNGGAVYLDLGTTLRASECSFVANAAEIAFGLGFYPASGGAIASLADALTVSRSAFVGNRSDAGGAVYAYRGTCRFTSVLLDGNRAQNQSQAGGFGGALASGTNAACVLEGCTIVANRASEDAGGIFADSTTGSCRLASCIVWDNTDSFGQVSESQLKGTRQHHCCVMNMLVPRPGEDPIDPTRFPSCTDLDPRFIDADGPDNAPGTEDDDLRLQPTSPCRDTGDPETVDATLDLAGDLRVLDGDLNGSLRTDMGAHEFAHARLAVQVTRLAGGGSRVRGDLSGTAGMAAALFLGAPAVPFVFPPFGAVWFDPAAAVAVPLGPLPAVLVLDAPAGAFDVLVQGLVAGGMAGQLANPVPLALR
jgi:hypothetical protein